jgi:hypothetical protein
MMEDEIRKLIVCMGAMRNACRILVGNPEGKRLLGRPRHKLKDGIKMAVMEISFDDMDRIIVAEDRDRWLALVNPVTNLQAP